MASPPDACLVNSTDHEVNPPLIIVHVVQPVVVTLLREIGFVTIKDNPRLWRIAVNLVGNLPMKLALDVGFDIDSDSAGLVLGIAWHLFGRPKAFVIA